MKIFNTRISLIQYLSFICTFLIILGSCKKEEGPETPDLPDGDYKVVAYVPQWGGIDFTRILAQNLSHINYAFAEVRNGVIFSSSEQDSSILSDLVGLKTKNPDLKVLISVGGANLSGGFSDAALTEESRSKFSSSVIDFIVKHKLDGVDLDWEFPGYGPDSRPEDKQNFTRMLNNLRYHLDSLSVLDMRMPENPYLLTIASGSASWSIDRMEINKITPVLDFYNVMDYDFKGSWSSTTGHHTNLYPSNDDPGSKFSSSSSVDLYLSYGVPPEKIIMGAAFYGRWWSGVTNQNKGLYQSYTGGAGALTFAAITTGYMSDPDFIQFWDSKAMAPYLWSSNDRIFITYDNDVSIKYKTEYIREKGIGGIMVWEYTQDYNNTLLGAITRGFR